MQTLTISQAVELASQYHNTGDLQQADAIYYQILQVQPTNNEALGFYLNFGGSLREQGKLNEAVECYQRVLALCPKFAEMHNDLGIVFCYQGKFTDAIDSFQQALASNPYDAKVYYNLGMAFKIQGKIGEAIDCYQRALNFKPDYADANNGLGNALLAQDKFDEAIACYQRALVLNPNYIEAHNNLGVAFENQGQLTEAVVSFQQALVLNPNDAKAHNNLATVKKNQGMISEAIEHYQKALEIKPTYAIAHTNLLFALNYAVNYDRATIFAAHQKFNEQHALPLAGTIKTHLNENQPQRKLKIGYISPNFHKHAVAYFIEPILAHHDHHQFEIFCYYNSLRTDAVTQRLQRYADHWFNCSKLSDEELAEHIRHNQIDILIDLAGHTDGNRLLVFARKPAPVQVTYLGYPNTTGFTTIDYRITDSYMDPQGITEPFNSETLIRMPASYFCYHPDADSPQINDLPAQKNGYITFSSLNNYCKLNPQLFALWAQILHAVTGSKLLVKTKSLIDSATRSTLLEQFGKLDIEPERLILENITPAPAYLQTYHQVDIGLDSYPFTGGTTTCEALWMGVPVVTLVGDRHASRQGFSILSALGLTELIAYSPEEYVDICVKLASDTKYLQQLRTEMRTRMQESPLMDGASFTSHLETAYRNMWEKWCIK